MKCYICGHQISQYQLKYGDANPVVRDTNGKIVKRGFHHDCLEQKIAQEELEEENKTNHKQKGIIRWTQTD